MAELSPIIESLDEVAPRYAAILCDVWGVIHNGVRAFQPATAALTLAAPNHHLPGVLFADRMCKLVVAQTVGLPIVQRGNLFVVALVFVAKLCVIAPILPGEKDPTQQQQRDCANK